MGILDDLRFASLAYRQKRPYRKELIVVTKVPAFARTWLMMVDPISWRNA
ncbi:MAG: hypothetical protein OJF50_001870 [Nitrospira sp.]|jgi:hypothetical protein|nr:hypothetical protein [Nitrospira sp.]